MTSEHFTQWIDYWIELNSIFTLNVILTMEKNFYWNGIPYISELGFQQKKKKNTRKMTLVTHELITISADNRQA